MQRRRRTRGGAAPVAGRRPGSRRPPVAPVGTTNPGVPSTLRAKLAGIEAHAPDRLVDVAEVGDGEGLVDERAGERRVLELGADPFEAVGERSDRGRRRGAARGSRSTGQNRAPAASVPDDRGREVGHERHVGDRHDPTARIPCAERRRCGAARGAHRWRCRCPSPRRARGPRRRRGPRRAGRSRPAAPTDPRAARRRAARATRASSPSRTVASTTSTVTARSPLRPGASCERRGVGPGPAGTPRPRRPRRRRGAPPACRSPASSSVPSRRAVRRTGRASRSRRPSPSRTPSWSKATPWWSVRRYSGWRRPRASTAGAPPAQVALVPDAGGEGVGVAHEHGATAAGAAASSSAFWRAAMSRRSPSVQHRSQAVAGRSRRRWASRAAIFSKRAGAAVLGTHVVAAHATAAPPEGVGEVARERRRAGRLGADDDDADRQSGAGRPAPVAPTPRPRRPGPPCRTSGPRHAPDRRGRARPGSGAPARRRRAPRRTRRRSALPPAPARRAGPRA